MIKTGEGFKMSNWVDDRLHSDEIDDLESYDITTFFKGKNILISPEGSGKSTTILNKIYELYQKNIPDIPLVIILRHTIENAIEKFNIITRNMNANIRIHGTHSRKK